MSTPNGQPLRFGALIRVSTERQEEQGESLSTQRSDCLRDVESLGGSVVEWYGGQEHATPGWEKKEVDRLIADASRGILDAVIVNKTDRWSRDNRKSEEGLDLFREHGVRFFVRTREYDLFDEDDEFSISIDVVVARRNARSYARNSLRNRIARARRGWPTCGQLPYGRTFDRKTGSWGLDSKKKVLIEDAAARYLKGQSLPLLASEIGLSHSQLYKVLVSHSGDSWEQEFRSARLKIHEVVPTPVPRLLDEDTIKSVRCRLESQRKRRSGGKPVNAYLLSGYIYCASCGYNLVGQANSVGVRYYCHVRGARKRECSANPRPFVRADDIEQAVLGDLFDLFGNPAAIERACKAAIPDCEKERERQDRVRKELAEVEAARQRILDLIVRDKVTVAQADRQLTGLSKREEVLKAELAKLDALLANVPDTKAIHCYVETLGDSIFVFDEGGDTYAGGNDVQSWILLMTDSGEDRRHLIESQFSVPMPDGSPAGVYITPAGGRPSRFVRRRFTYELKGRLVWRVTPRPLYLPGKKHNALPFKVAGVLG